MQFISATEALADFRAQSGFGAALDQLAENPLPHTLVVRPSAGNTSASMVLLHEELANLPETEHVQVDTEWVQRFHAILDIVRQAIAIGAALLGIAIIVIMMGIGYTAMPLAAQQGPLSSPLNSKEKIIKQ